jgi:hypothetical protein
LQALIHTAPALRDISVGPPSVAEGFGAQHIDALGRFSALTYAACFSEVELRV